MFVIELIYKADLAEIDAHMAAHVAFLRKYYVAGNFIVSGRKVPRDGGIILAVGRSREQIEAILALHHGPPPSYSYAKVGPDRVVVDTTAR